MIDGIKFDIDPDAVKDSDVLVFHRINETRQTAKYKGLIIELYPDSCRIRGSLHKYKNEGIHNADDFKLSEFVQVINDLSATLNFNPEVTLFYSVEFGVNIDLPFETHLFTNSIVYCRRGTQTNAPKGITIKFSEYEIKIYLKDNNTSNNRLRFEIKINRVRRLKRIIKENVFSSTLADLANPILWQSFGKELLSVYDSLLIVDRDSIDIQNLNGNDAKLFLSGCNSGYWSKKWSNRTTRQRKLKRFQEIVFNSTSTMKEDVKVLISEKINSLIDVQNVTKSPFAKSEIGDKNVTFSAFAKSEVEDEKMLRFPHLRKEGKGEKMLRFPSLDNSGFRNTCYEQKRNCKVTGLSLEIGIKQGEYLSAKGVEFYHQNHPDIFAEKLYTRLSKKWVDSELKIQFREIAHSIRNEIFNKENNPRNNFKRDIKKREDSGMNLLFSLTETIRPDKRKFLS